MESDEGPIRLERYRDGRRRRRPMMESNKFHDNRVPLMYITTVRRASVCALSVCVCVRVCTGARARPFCHGWRHRSIETKTMVPAALKVAAAAAGGRRTQRRCGCTSRFSVCRHPSVHICSHTCTRALTHTHKHTHSHKLTHIHTNTYRHTNTRTHTHNTHRSRRPRRKRKRPPSVRPCAKTETDDDDCRVAPGG